VSSGKVGEDALPEVLVLAAAEDDVGNGLSPLSTAVAGASDVRNVSIKRKSLSPIFSVRSCTSSALSRLLSLSWSYSTLVGVGVCLYVARPFFSSLYALIHALSAYVLHYLLSVILSGYSCAGGSASCWLRPSSLHPVASLAAWSAASFPGMPT
jgi:hypothetical protein